MLQQQLDADGEGEQRGDRLRHAEQQQRQGAAERFQAQVQGMLHQPVETVQALHAMVHRVQPPKQRRTVAGVVHQGDAEIGQDDRQQQLQPQRPGLRPYRPEAQDSGQQWQGEDAKCVQAFVDRRVQDIAQAVGVRPVPAWLVGQSSFGEKGQAERPEEQGDQPGVGSLAIADLPGCQADEAGPEEGA